MSFRHGLPGVKDTRARKEFERVLQALATPFRPGAADMYPLPRDVCWSLSPDRQEADASLRSNGIQAVDFLAAAATEEQAFAAAEKTEYLHFACHTLPNERFPLDSAIVLALPPASRKGRQTAPAGNGKYSRGENAMPSGGYFPDARPPSERKWGGEGLIGLTRAFQLCRRRFGCRSL